MAFSQATTVSQSLKQTDLVYFCVKENIKGNLYTVVLEFNYQSFHIVKYKDGTKIKNFSFIEIKKVQTDGVDIVVQFNNEPPSSLKTYCEDDCVNIYTILLTIINNIGEIMNRTTDKIVKSCLDAKPKLCYRMVDVTQKKFRSSKKSLNMKSIKKKKDGMVNGKKTNFIVLTEKHLILFSDREETVPLYLFPRVCTKVIKKSDSDFGIVCKDAKGTFSCTDCDIRDLWIDAVEADIIDDDDELNQVEINLRTLYETTFDHDNEEHVLFLRRLWDASDLGKDNDSEETYEFAIKSDRWKILGFQRDDPISDLRATGLLGLQNLVYFAEQYHKLFMQMARNQEQSSDMEYPFCTAGINISFLLIKLLELEVEDDWFPNFQTHPLFFHHSSAWQELYGISFRLFDQKWNQMKVGYLGFQKVIDNVQETLAGLLSKPNVLGVPAIFDMLGIFLEDLKAFKGENPKLVRYNSYKITRNLSKKNYNLEKRKHPLCNNNNNDNDSDNDNDNKDNNDNNNNDDSTEITINENDDSKPQIKKSSTTGSLIEDNQQPNIVNGKRISLCISDTKTLNTSLNHSNNIDLVQFTEAKPRKRSKSLRKKFRNSVRVTSVTK